MDYLGAINSPLQFQPALQMILGLDVKPDQRRALLVQLGASVNAVPADDRSFETVTAAITPGLPALLTPALQRFIASHDTASVCGASAPSDKAGEQTAEEQRIAAEQMNLMFTGGTLVSRADRATPEWERRLDDFLSRIADWQQGPEESDALYYHRRIAVYKGLLDVTSGAPRARLIDEMVHFALSSSVLRDAPAEWFVELKTANERVQAGSVPGPDVLRGFERSGHPVLVLAAALEGTLGK